MGFGDNIFGYETSTPILDGDFVVRFISCCRGVDEPFGFYVGNVSDVFNQFLSDDGHTRVCTCM